MANPIEILKLIVRGDTSGARKALADLGAQARTAARGIIGSFGGVQEHFVGLRSVIAALGIGALFRTIVRETAEAERATAQLETVLKSTAGAAGLSRDELTKMAESLQKLTAYSDDAIIGVQSLLLGFTNISKADGIFEDATKAVLNLATTFNRDLKESALLVGKALDEPIEGASALTRAGVKLDDSQKRVVKSLFETGQAAAAQRVILEELNKTTGDSAIAIRNTFGGAIEALGLAFHDLLEGKGGGLVESKRQTEELIALLRDPATADAFNVLTTFVFSLGAGILKFLTNTALAARTLVGYIREARGTETLGDELAILDRQRKLLEVQRDALEKRLIVFPDQEQRIDHMRAEIADLEQRLIRLKEPGRARLGTKVSGVIDRSASAPKKTETPAALTIDARPALKEVQSKLAAASALLQDELKRVGAALDRDFGQNLIRFSEYFERRAALERRAADEQLAAQRAELALLDEEIRLSKNGEGDTAESESKRRALVVEITALERERADAAVKAANAQTDAERGLQDELTAVRNRLLALQGDDVAARSTALASEFRDLLTRLTTEGDEAGQALVRKLFDVELARTRLEELQTDYETTLADLARAEKRVQIEVDTGVRTEREGRREIMELHKATAAELDRLIPRMRELADASGDPQAIERLKDMQLELEQLRDTADDAARELGRTVRDSGEGAFASYLKGARDARSATQDFFDDLRSRFADLASEAIFDKLFTSLGQLGGGAGGKGGGFEKFLAAIFHGGGVAGQSTPMRSVPAALFARAPRFHAGGVAGLSSNEVPAILQRGERVLTVGQTEKLDRGSSWQSWPKIELTVVTPTPRAFTASEGQIAASLASALRRAENRYGSR